MRSLSLLTAFVLSTLSACGSSQEVNPLAERSIRADLARETYIYATKMGQPLKLDWIIDRAVKVHGKRPIILFMYGGGWESGSRNDSAFSKSYEFFTSAGYGIVTIDYRLGVKIAKERHELTPDNGLEIYLRAIDWSVEDLFDATTFVTQHATDWGIDPAQIVLLGASAGATNALVAEYNVANETRVAQTHLPDRFRYAGVISMAGAFWLKANTPLTFRNKPAPIMFFHGAKDQLVTYDEVQGQFSGYGPTYYLRKFAGPDFPKWFVDYPQGDHVIALTPIMDQKVEMQAFLQKLVRERQAVSIHTVEEDRTPKSLEGLIKAMKGG